MTNLEDLRKQAYDDFAKGDFRASLSELQQVERAVGLDAELANDQAVTLYKLGQVPDAIEMFRRSSELGGDSMVAPNVIELLSEQARELETKQGQQPAAAPAPAPAPAAATTMFDEFGKRVVSAALRVWQANSANELHSAAARLTDEQWAEVLYASVEGQPFGNYMLPGFMDEETQRIFVGSSGVNAMREGYNFIRVVLDYMQRFGPRFSEETKIVDFGSGWGRYTRFMLKYVHPDNIYGLEVSDQMVEHCRKAFGMGNFMKVGTFPPCDLRDGLIDLSFGYSVFSHLAPHCADAWIREFARITRPGGLVMMTTQGRTFIEYCREIRERNDRSHPWYITLADSFVDVEKSYRDYDNGEFLHANHGQYDGTYGESLISRGYIERNWTRDFELVDFVDDRQFLPQALFVLRRR